MLELDTIFSVIVGGIITLGATAGVSWWELRRREKRKEQNWYRRVRQLAIRSYTPKKTMFFTDSEQREIIARTYESSSEQLQELLADPYADTDPQLYSAIQQLVYYLNQYVNRDPEERDDTARVLDNSEVQEYATIVMYYIENEIEYDLDFGEELEGDDLDTARERYEEWLESAEDDEGTEDGEDSETNTEIAEAK